MWQLGVGLISFFAISLALIFPDVGQAQQSPAREFVPGDLMIGFASEQDREAAAKKLREKKLGVRGEKAAGVHVETVGPTGLLLHIELPESLKPRDSWQSASELSLLEEIANKLKASNPSVVYAHPNWITKLDRPGPRLPAPPEGAEIQLQSGKIKPQSCRKASRPTILTSSKACSGIILHHLKG